MREPVLSNVNIVFASDPALALAQTVLREAYKRAVCTEAHSRWPAQHREHMLHELGVTVSEPHIALSEVRR